MTALFVPLALGTLLWSGIGLAAFPRELWDVAEFWTVWPAAIVLTGVCGFVWPGHALRHAGLAFGALPVVMLATGLATGSSFSLLPLGLVAMAALALPGAILAAATGWLARQR
ncbi:hypothetical protein [Tabrizicola sp. BL-A-41-H6]|uniref:hypothetical protein n=1 Tax=Tabrizicola sp. BL-A-41-H6 TaxID=3421107 RepID=UPI003D672B60